ncbi:uncharacterized protein LOC130758873 isoform X2 [Actinidia eriantha]|uniref:uncharacterized protein LOC130758873 isoform X2 n=1 Tax=Actinidia eriantha TaxID=165200 RepID=UPI0025826FE0|nr:uncharacterized protein LOC130758873 isoform X2 [Actinidia eriantha]
MEFKCSDVHLWREALSSYKAHMESLNKPNLVSLDDFYTDELPLLIRQRNPNPHITTPELSKLMQWKLTRGKWRPRLLDFVSSLDEALVKSASQKAFKSLPDVSKAVSELTVLKGVGPATASAVLAAYAPDVAPFMSDEELSAEGDIFTPSDVERALWSATIGAKLPAASAQPDLKVNSNKNSKRKRKR